MKNTSLLLSLIVLTPITYGQVITVSTLEGYYDQRVVGTPGWTAFDNAVLKSGEYQGVEDPNSQGFRDPRDHILTFQFGGTIEVEKLLLGVYNLKTSSGTFSIFEVGDVSGDLTGDLAAPALFSGSFATAQTTFTTQVGNRQVGTLVFDLPTAVTVQDRTSVSASAGYAFQFDFDTSNGFDLSNRIALPTPTVWSSMYRNDPGNDYSAPLEGNNFMVGFVVPEPSTYALMAGALGLGVALLRRRRQS